MALHSLIWTKPPTPYFRPPPIHLCMVMVAEQPRVVAWEFDASGARPASFKAQCAGLYFGRTVGGKSHHL
ncbi:hypothetical protein VZT92_004605 [Zoarces viviparus]|uniref:Uncharacterized protein n=1 Tax=Zoarces viviparus TaxID=48416 RepID=A0AAW1FY08_ZOAVI